MRDPKLTGKCDRCHQPCAPAGEGITLLRGVFKTVLNARFEPALLDQQAPLLCGPCYLVHRDMVGAQKTAEAVARQAFDAVERYEVLVDKAGRGGEKAPAPGEFFTADTLAGKTLDAKYQARLDTAIRRARAGASRGTGDM